MWAKMMSGGNNFIVRARGKSLKLKENINSSRFQLSLMSKANLILQIEVRCGVKVTQFYHEVTPHDKPIELEYI